MKMHIITGKYKNRKLKTIDAESVSKSVITNAVFNIIGEKIKSAAIIDLCSNNGYYAIEALSRGAKSAIINESDRKKLNIIKKTIEEICEDERIKFTSVDGRFLKLPTFNQIDIVFCKSPQDEITFSYDAIKKKQKNKGSLKEVLFALECGEQEMKFICDQYKDDGMRRYGKSFLKIWYI
jgi:16S rRNA (guanine(966)-N(2))-methyltransferase RsmD